MLADDAFGVTPRIPGPVVTLEPLGPQHLEPYLSMLSDPETELLTGSTGRTFSREQIVDWLGSRAGRTDRADFAIVATTTGAFLGEAVLNEFDAALESANFRIALAGPQVFGKGFGTAATRMTVTYGFDVVGLHRIHLAVFSMNPRARRAYEKSGFRYEGTLRDAHHDVNGWHDEICMGILSTDPR